MKDKNSILEPEGIYHIYHRANGNELLFRNSENYRYFIEKFKEYILPLADIFCYCLMPNHFHFLVRIKSKEEIRLAFSTKKTLQGFETLEGLGLSKLLSQQFSHCFNGYTQAFNKQHNRKGSLFMHTFKRKLIDNDTYLRKVIHYIHFNPVEAGIAKTPADWKYSSYQAIIGSHTKTVILKEEVIAYFDNVSNFIYCHSHPPNETGIEFI